MDAGAAGVDPAITGAEAFDAVDPLAAWDEVVAVAVDPPVATADGAGADAVDPPAAVADVMAAGAAA